MAATTSTAASKIADLASPEAVKSNNDSKQLSVLAKEKQEKEGKDIFELFQADFLVQNPDLVSEQVRTMEPFSTIFPSEITKLTMAYARQPESLQLAAIVPPILSAYSSEIYEIMKSRKLVSEKLLPHVFAANPNEVDAFLRTSGIHPKILLTESPYAEGYQSKKLNKFVCFRRYKAVSALVAAYRCGDFRFGRRILALMLRDNTLSHAERDGLRVIAREQLIELSERIGTPMGTETANIKTSAVTTVATANVGSAGAASAAIAVSPNNTADNKEKVEFNSGSSANTDEFADNDEFLSAIVKLINAYKSYTSQYDSLAAGNKWTEIDKLWGEVCECHKRLYHYVHLEFFSPTPFSPVSRELFIAEPPRGTCRYDDNDLLDLDAIGADTLSGLYKGVRALARDVLCWRPERGGVGLCELDLAAMRHLYKLRVDDLRNTVDQLHSLESALIFLNGNKPSLRNAELMAINHLYKLRVDDLRNTIDQLHLLELR